MNLLRELEAGWGGGRAAKVQARCPLTATPTSRSEQFQRGLQLDVSLALGLPASLTLGFFSQPHLSDAQKVPFVSVVKIGVLSAFRSHWEMWAACEATPSPNQIWNGHSHC